MATKQTKETPADEAKETPTDETMENIDLSHEKTVKIVIHKSETDPKSKVVPVSINGKTWLIKRGEQVDVPLSVLEVLKNASKDTYAQDDNGELVKRVVPSYPFSVL